jgi:hypothetical protein
MTETSDTPEVRSPDLYAKCRQLFERFDLAARPVSLRDPRPLDMVLLVPGDPVSFALIATTGGDDPEFYVDTLGYADGPVLKSGPADEDDVRPGRQWRRASRCRVTVRSSAGKVMVTRSALSSTRAQANARGQPSR